MKKILFYAVILTVCFTSCNKEEFIENNELAPEEAPTLAKVYSADVSANTLRPFATALYDALKESPRLREIIKTEALKQFNKEYDVLYQFIKDEWVEDGQTVRQLLLKHFENEENLATIETSHPTLTIFVPQLPENSFSAEIWNTVEQIPAVAIHSTKQLHIPIIADYGFFDENSNEFILEAGLIPAFPVVVIKDNARVVVAKNGETRSPALKAKKGDFKFEFTNEFFDGSKVISTQSVSTSYIDQKLVDAYDFYKGTDGWQRDYIYYGLAPSPAGTQITPGGTKLIGKGIQPDPSEDEAPRGTLTRDFRETIVSFRFSYSTDPEDMLWYLTNHDGDPVLKPITSSFFGNPTALPWTTGKYTFEVSIAAATSGTAKLRMPFIAKPEELFEVSFTKVLVSTLAVYFPKVTGYKTKYFDKNDPNDKRELMTWNLDTYEPELKISIAKENPDQEITITNTTTTEFAANIKGDFKFGEKYGLGGELSGKTKKEQQHTTKTKLSNKYLGDVLIEFGDMVLLRKPSYDHNNQIIDDGLREYGNGMFVIKVAPVRMQNHQN